MTPAPQPGALARVVRSGFVESVHHGHAVVLGPSGEVVAVVGDAYAPVFPRSAAKPLQTVAMLRSGLELPPHLLALASASHSGSERHLEGVRDILERAGLPAQALDNTPDLPLGRAERAEWRARGAPASALAQNCSGQHAAMLLTCQLRGWPASGYLDPHHPLQQEMSSTLTEFFGTAAAVVGVDGCGALTPAVPLVGVARAFSRLALGSMGSDEGAVADAIRRHPVLLGGAGREVTRLLEGVPGLVAKDGAEAVFAAALPDGSAVALKVGDGSSRAVWPAAVALLRRLGVVAPVLDELATTPVRGHGRVVGAVEAGGALASE